MSSDSHNNFYFHNFHFTDEKSETEYDIKKLGWEFSPLLNLVVFFTFENGENLKELANFLIAENYFKIRRNADSSREEALV